MIEFDKVNSAGFFSNYFTVVSTMVDCDNRKLIPYVNINNKYWNCGGRNLWNAWFVQMQPTTQDEKIVVPLNKKHFDHKVRHWYMDNRRIKEVIYKYCKTQPQIVKRAEEFYDNNLKGYEFISVLCRTTEMNLVHPEYGVRTIADHINKVKEALDKYNHIKKIYLVTEDSESVKEFKLEFGDILCCFDGVFRRTNEDYTNINDKDGMWFLNSNRRNHLDLLGAECLYQTLVLSKGTYFVCKQSGISSAALVWSKSFKNCIYV